MQVKYFVEPKTNRKETLQLLSPHLDHAEQSREGGHGVERELADVHLDDSQVHELLPRGEHEEEDEREDGEHQDEDADEQPLVGARTVDGVVVRRALVVGPGPGQPSPLQLGVEGLARGRGRGHLGDVLPHDVQYGGADERVLDGAREEEGAGVLHQGADDVGSAALVDVVRPLQASGHPVVGRVVAGLGVGVGVGGRGGRRRQRERREVEPWRTKA